jgi:FtsP/CotA-like multicopper oxidase with cupredoxin domain
MDQRRPSKGLSRRAVLRGAAAMTGALAAPRVARAVADHPLTEADFVPRPGATQYAFDIGGATINPDGQQEVAAILVNGMLPGPEVRVREGEQLRIVVKNQLPDAPTSIHWHGVLLPAAMDGVPDVSNAPIVPGQMYVYEYPIRQTGTYWYHSHVGFQEQRGCYGAFIIEPKHAPQPAERDAVVLLGDWLHRSPTDVYDQLRAAAGAAPMGTPGMGAMQMKGGRGADLSDVRYDSFLLNGRGPDNPWALAVPPGERVRLRLINGAGSTYFRVHLDGHPLRITHADGLAVQPVVVDHLLMGMGETYDALVAIGERGSYTLHAVAQDGSGQALGVLHTLGSKPEADRDMPSFGGRALAYAGLRAPAPTTLPAGPVRAFRLPLQGDMARYVWMIDGQAWPKADPLRIHPGDRVQIELANQTMMWHPMHLHGHFFRLLQGAGDYCPLKHTVNVAPGDTVRIEFTADNPGRWFFHCHNTYHLEAGMARVFEYVTE